MSSEASISATPMNLAGRTAMAARRLAAFMVDWLVIAAWGALLFAAAWMATGGTFEPMSPWKGQAVGLVCMTLPVLLYFAVCESSLWGGTLGKRALGLRVQRMGGGRVSLRRALGRNAVKLAPWEFGHLVAQQMIAGSQEAIPVWVWIAMILAYGLPLWWMLAIVSTGAAPYDLMAGTRVVRRSSDVPGELAGRR